MKYNDYGIKGLKKEEDRSSLRSYIQCGLNGQLDCVFAAMKFRRFMVD